MNTPLTLPPRTVHLWLATLSHFIEAEQSLLALLSPDEVARAMQFRLLLHKQRFIITRGLLRKILSQYISIPAEKIIFDYGAHGKPYLKDNSSALQFNLSHSEDMAVFALTTQQEIGVDIEKMQPSFKEKLAKRFFSPEEYTQLMCLPKERRIKGFYQIWARKEALIKAQGTGVFTALADFSINLAADKDFVSFTYLDQPLHYYIETICVPDFYQGAFATEEQIEHVVYQEFGKRS